MIGYPDIREIIATINYQSRTLKDVPIYGSLELGIWFFYQVYEKIESPLFQDYLQTTSREIFWNAFGLIDPHERTILPIMAELNISLMGSRKTGGILYGDDRGRVFVGHTGRTSITKKLFWDLYSGDRTLVCDEDGKNEMHVAVIGEVSDPKLLLHVSKFVKQLGVLKKQKG